MIRWPKTRTNGRHAVSTTYTIGRGDFKALSKGTAITVRKAIPEGTCEIAIPGKKPLKCRVKKADKDGFVLIEAD